MRAAKELKLRVSSRIKFVNACVAFASSWQEVNIVLQCVALSSVREVSIVLQGVALDGEQEQWLKKCDTMLKF